MSTAKQAMDSKARVVAAIDKHVKAINERNKTFGDEPDLVLEDFSVTERYLIGVVSVLSVQIEDLYKSRGR